MARQEEDQDSEKFGLDVLTVAVLAILITAPVGALGIGLAGPRLLDRQVKGQSTFSFQCHLRSLVQRMDVFDGTFPPLPFCFVSLLSSLLR